MRSASMRCHGCDASTPPCLRNQMMIPHWSAVMPLLSRPCPAGPTPILEGLAASGATRIGRDTCNTAHLRPAGAASGDERKPRFWADEARFLLEWLRHPRGTAAIAPSGAALASLITREIDDTTGPVLELGPGTGVFTRAIIQRGVAERDLTLIEQSRSFASMLKSRFPASTVLNIDAVELHRSAQQTEQSFGAVVCGLGLRNMIAQQVESIVRVSFTVLRPTAPFYLFTYGGRCSVPDDVLARLGLSAQKLGSTFRNLPPASVYRLQRIGTTQ